MIYIYNDVPSLILPFVAATMGLWHWRQISKLEAKAETKKIRFELRSDVGA